MACLLCAQGCGRHSFTAEEEARAKAYDAKRAVRLATQEALAAEKTTADREKAIAEHKIWIGMKEAELQRSVGAPETKTTVADASGSLVIWEYPSLRVTVADGIVRKYVLTK